MALTGAGGLDLGLAPQALGQVCCAPRAARPVRVSQAAAPLAESWRGACALAWTALRAGDVNGAGALAAGPCQRTAVHLWSCAARLRRCQDQDVCAVRDLAHAAVARGA